MTTRAISAWRILALATLSTAIAIVALVPARATTPLQSHRRQQHGLAERTARIRHDHHHLVRRLSAVIRHADATLREGPGRGGRANPGRWRQLGRRLRHARWASSLRIRLSERLTLRRLEVLAEQRASIRSWEEWGIFEVCPIQGWRDVSDNFGITVRLPDVPVHRHMGNDILALTGTPIVAPFDGHATASRSWLGGMEVQVDGAQGSVYNAHLSRFGSLGAVHAGDVIGYVGSTGDATAPHDHFEWHPHQGDAVDPYPFLSAACG